MINFVTERTSLRKAPEELESTNKNVKTFISCVNTPASNRERAREKSIRLNTNDDGK